MSGDNLSTTTSPTPKKVRTSLQIRITNLAVPIRLHIYGFLNDTDIRCPEIYGRIRYGEKMDPCLPLPYNHRQWKGIFLIYEPCFIETAFSAMMGDCEVLQYLQGMPSNVWAVENPNISRCLSEEDMKDFFYFLTVLIVGYNNIKTLRYARQILFPWNEWALDVGIRYGVDLPILKWMHKQGCPFSESSLAVAALWRNTDVLEWLLNIKCPMSEWTLEFAVKGNCSLEHIIWLRSHGCPWYDISLQSALRRDDSLSVVQYLLEENLSGSFAPLPTIIKNGNVSHLKLMHEANVLFDESHFYQAIANNRPIEFLQYLLKCIASEWDAGTFSLAVKGGNLSLLKWLKEEGCSWDASVFITAIKIGNRDIIRWLHEEKCPMNEAAMDHLMEKFVYHHCDCDEDDEEAEEEHIDEEAREVIDDDDDEEEEDFSENDESGDY
jgi:hypothetical protein